VTSRAEAARMPEATPASAPCSAAMVTLGLCNPLQDR
jgi:hypothetical protein